MSVMERAHLVTAELRSALHEAHEAADRLCAVFMRAKNGAADQGAIDKATRRVYSAMHELERRAEEFNALCVRIREGRVIKDGNGTPLGFAPEGGDDDGDPGSAA